jgi:hypothetical protein
MGKDGVLRDRREQLTGHVGRELDDFAGFDLDPFRVGAGDAYKPREIGLGHAKKLRFFSAHDVGLIDARLSDAGQDADIPARTDTNGALVQRIETRRCLEIGRLGPARLQLCSFTLPTPRD